MAGPIPPTYVIPTRKKGPFSSLSFRPRSRHAQSRLPESFLHDARHARDPHGSTGRGAEYATGTLTDSTPAPTGSSLRGSGIEGGVSRRVTKGDVIIIPGHTPHWFSELETDIEYLIFRTDPDNRLPLR